MCGEQHRLQKRQRRRVDHGPRALLAWMTGRDESQGQPQRPLGDLPQDAVITRSEEELVVTSERRATQRARLVKFVEDEMETITVPVRREQARIEYEPVSRQHGEPGGLGAGPASPEERWMVLYGEEVLVQTRWVALERVRLSTHVVIEDLEISEDLRREQIEIDDTTQGG